MTYTWYKYTSHVELELFKMTDIINTHIVGLNPSRLKLLKLQCTCTVTMVTCK